MYTIKDLGRIDVLINAQREQIERGLQGVYDAYDVLMLGHTYDGIRVSTQEAHELIDACEAKLMCLENTMAMYQRRRNQILKDLGRAPSSEAANDEVEIDPKGKNFWGHHNEALALMVSMGVDAKQWGDSIFAKHARGMTYTNQRRLDELHHAKHVFALYETAEFLWSGSGLAVLTACATAWGIKVHELHRVPTHKIQAVQFSLDGDAIQRAFKVAA